VFEDQAHAAAAWSDDPRLALREIVWDGALVGVVVDAADYLAGEGCGKVSREGIVVDEEPAGVLRVEAIAREVTEGDEVVWFEPCWVESGLKFRAESEVCSGKVGERDVQGMRWGVGAEVGEEEGGAE
jgi:hypothetical protein